MTNVRSEGSESSMSNENTVQWQKIMIKERKPKTYTNQNFNYPYQITTKQMREET